MSDVKMQFIGGPHEGDNSVTWPPGCDTFVGLGVYDAIGPGLDDHGRPVQRMQWRGEATPEAPIELQPGAGIVIMVPVIHANNLPARLGIFGSAYTSIAITLVCLMGGGILGILIGALLRSRLLP